MGALLAAIFAEVDLTAPQMRAPIAPAGPPVLEWTEYDTLGVPLPLPTAIGRAGGKRERKYRRIQMRAEGR